jgi:hypothetical protein
MTHMPTTALAEDVRFFPTLSCVSPAPDAARRVVELAWLLMGEGFPILEDLDGADRDADLAESLKFSFAEFLADLDARLTGAACNDTTHELATAVEYGPRALCALDGPDFAALLGLAAVEDHARTTLRIRGIWDRMLRDFPVALVDPLQPNTQGEVLRRLRAFTKLCEANGVDTAFLVEMMKVV